MAHYNVTPLGEGNILRNKYNIHYKYFSVKKGTNVNRPPSPAANAESVANARAPGASGVAPGASAANAASRAASVAPGAAGVAPAAPGQLKNIDPNSVYFNEFKQALEREQLPWLQEIANRSETLSPKELQSLKKKVEQNLDNYEAIYTLLETFSNTRGETNEMVKLLIRIFSFISTNIDGQEGNKGPEFRVKEMFAAYVYHRGIPALFIGGQKKISTQRMRSVKRSDKRSVKRSVKRSDKRSVKRSDKRSDKRRRTHRARR